MNDLDYPSDSPSHNLMSHMLLLGYLDRSYLNIKYNSVIHVKMESNDEEVVYKHKIKRKSNFSRRQVETLLDEIMIQENQDILFSYNFTPYTNDQKEKIWKAITDKINDCEKFSEKRTISNVRRKWVNLLSFTKKRYMDNSQSIKIMTPIERRIINLVKERPSLWNDSKRSDFGTNVDQHTITTTSLSPDEMRPTQDLLDQCATQAKRVYFPLQLQGVSNFNNIHVKGIHSVSNSKNSGSTRSLSSDVEQDKDNYVLQRPQASTAINIQPDNEVGHMFIKQEVESEDEHCFERNNEPLDIPSNSRHTIVDSECTPSHAMSDASTNTDLYSQVKLQLSSDTVNNEQPHLFQRPMESSTGSLNNDSYYRHQRPIESSVGIVNNESYPRQIFENVAAAQSNVPEINSDDFFYEFEKTERHNIQKRKRKIESYNALSIEKERLVVEKQRLNVEKQRLEIEKRRLQIEEIRLKMEQERVNAKQ